jgi:hypothetical protein
MISTPTDRLHKFAAIGGLAIAFASGGAALQQYHQTSLQIAEAYEKVLRGVNAYNRFAEVARGGIESAEKLRDPSISAADEKRHRKALAVSQERIKVLDAEAQEAIVQMQKQMSIAQHYDRMQSIWFVIAGFSLISGLLLSWYGFRSWLRQPANER